MVSLRFSISKLAVQVLSYDTTPKGLAEDVSTAITSDRSKNSPPDEGLKVKTDASNELQLHTSTSPPSNEDKSLGTLDGSLAIPDISNVTAKDEKVPTIKAGTWFFAEIGIGGTSEMSSALNLAADPTASSQAKIILYAQVGSGAASSSLYYIDIRKLKLVGGALEMNGSGVYSRDTSAEAKRQIDIVGTLSLQLRQKIDFKVEYHSRKGETKFDIATNWTSTANIDRPFEDMFNVELKELTISGTIAEGKPTEYKVSGLVKLGSSASGETESQLRGVIAFVDGKPIAGILTFTPEAAAKTDDCLSVGDVYSKLLNDGSSSLSYSQDDPSFSFTSATVAYVSGERPYAYGDRTYGPGFTLQASVYMFDVPFSLALNLGTSKKDGISFTATYERSIDLDFAEIVGFREDSTRPREKGPAVEFSAKNDDKRIIVKAGISFFKTPVLDISLGYDFTNKYFQGTLNFGALFGMKDTTKTTVKFTYKDGQFTFQGLNILDGFDGRKGMKKALDINKLLETGGKGREDTCGKLVGFAFRETIITKFMLRLSLPENPNSPSASQPPGTDAKTKGAIGGKYKSIVGSNRAAGGCQDRPGSSHFHRKHRDGSVFIPSQDQQRRTAVYAWRCHDQERSEDDRSHCHGPEAADGYSSHPCI
ncbi:hypothetical protein OPT61_g6954 [Boeremia exigua]|uniref:Uncharacterized protein n=1 Tax=Boeremia exigua TaxID=749465 RepID=A0ACC2I4M6_9PLEO|nr:hypothetical protein OPT61_g6954 [Boeremia exigua]